MKINNKKNKIEKNKYNLDNKINIHLNNHFINTSILIIK